MLNPSKCNFLDGGGCLKSQMRIENPTRYLFGGQIASADCLIRTLEFLSNLLDGNDIEDYDWREIEDFRDVEI